MRDSKSRFQWQHVYYCLAAVDLITIGFTLYLSSLIMGVYTESVAENSVWAKRLEDYSELRQLATDVNAPGNSVFDTRNVPAESARADTALVEFQKGLDRVRTEIQNNTPAVVASDLQTLFESVEGAMAAMVAESRQIFEFFRTDRSDLAGARMNAMDLRFYGVNRAISAIETRVRAVQFDNFESQTARAEQLRGYEYGVAFAILLIVIAVTVYGHRMALVVKAEQEASRKLEQEAWLQRHQAGLTELLTGNVSVVEISTRALNYLLEAIRAPAGAVFSRVGDELVLQASEGTLTGDRGVQSYALGDGLIGRVARSGKPLYIENPPADYLRIESGTGSAGPTHLALIPLGSEAAAPGVLELALFAAPSDLQTLLLARCRESLGSALAAAAAREHSEVLLEQTIAQAKELQLQQEQLGFINKELDNNKYKSEFLSNMSHELRTPLNSMLILSNALAENRDGNLNASQVESARVVHSGAKELLVLIDETLDFAKLEAGKVDLVLENVDLIALTESLTGQFVPVGEEKSLSFRATVADTAPQVIETDGLRLGQILKNLLSNAMKFTAAGEVALQVELVDSRDLPAALAGNGPVVAFRVTDTGIGVPESKRALIFEPFHQADGSITRSHGGTGLGLSISRDLAVLLGGELRLEDSSTSGSMFVLYLPCEVPISRGSSGSAGGITDKSLAEAQVEVGVPASTEAASPPVHCRQAGDGAALVGRKVLLVDDDVRNIFALSSLLTDAGMVVESATNGKMGIEKLKSMGKFDVVIMDIMMPVMDGIEAMREIRSLEEFEDLPIAALTARRSSRDREACLSAGASKYLSKPFDPGSLISLIGKLLTGSALRA